MSKTTKITQGEFVQVSMFSRWSDDGVGQPAPQKPEPEQEPEYTCTQCDELTNGNSQLCVYCKNAVVRKILG